MEEAPEQIVELVSEIKTEIGRLASQQAYLEGELVRYEETWDIPTNVQATN